MPLDKLALDELKREATRGLHKDAQLFSLETAVPTLLYGKPALWIPRAVSDQPGGRESVYDIPLNEEVLLGIYVLNLQIVRELVTRKSDKRYAMSMQTVGGKEIFSGEGDMEVINGDIGHGRVRFVGKRTEVGKVLFDIEPGPQNKTSVWVIFSCIKVDHE